MTHSKIMGGEEVNVYFVKWKRDNYEKGNWERRTCNSIWLVLRQICLGKVTPVNLEFENDVLHIIPSLVTFVMPSHTQFEGHRSM